MRRLWRESSELSRGRAEKEEAKRRSTEDLAGQRVLIETGKEQSKFPKDHILNILNSKIAATRCRLPLSCDVVLGASAAIQDNSSFEESIS